jgi:uncharacterized protein YdgA (DUF945 family)
MKKVVIAGIAAGATVAIVATAYVGGAFWAGKAAEQSLQKQHDWLAGQPYFIVKSRKYQRGWFSSTEETKLAVNPELYRYFLQKEGEALPEFEISYTHHIQHGPLPLLGQFNLRPYKAVVTTQFEFAPETRKKIEQIFGKQSPIEIENRIAFNDDGTMNIRIPAFEYEEAISGVKAQWRGLNATVAYGGDFNSLDLTSNVPGFTGDAKQFGHVGLEHLQLEMDQHRGHAGLMVGNTHAQLGQFTLKMQHEDQPFALQLDKLGYAGKLAEQGDFLNGTANIQLAKLGLDGQSYGPLDISAEATHLHGPTLYKLSQEFNRLQKAKLTQEQLGEEIIKLAQTHGTPLLKHDPQFAIKKLDISLPDGKIHFAGAVGIKGFKEEDLNNAPQLIGKLDAHADFTVPRKVVETLVRWQFRSKLGSQGNISEADLDYLAEQLVEGQINRLAEQKLIRIEGDKLAATATLKAGKFMLNGAEVPLPWQQQ